MKSLIALRRSAFRKAYLALFVLFALYIAGCRGNYSEEMPEEGKILGSRGDASSSFALFDCRSEGEDCDCLSITVDEVSTLPPSIVLFSFSADTCRGEPVYSLSEDNITVYENGVTLSRFEADYLLIKRPKGYYIPMLVLIDLSGSIVESGNIRVMQEALSGFLRKVSDSVSEIAVYGFDGREDIFPIHTFSRDISSIQKEIKGLSDWQVVDESTNLNGAVLQGIELLEKRVRENAEKISRGILVVFTDGTDQASRVSWYEVSEKLKETKAMIFSIGLGGEVNRDILSQVGKDGFEWARNSNELIDAFDRVAQHIFNLGQRFYTFAYCSPKRAGEHVATLVINWNGFQGKAEFSFRADGFEGGCSRTLIQEKMIR